MAKGALITGITGQDGAYLAEFLLNVASLRLANNADAAKIFSIAFYK